VRIDHSVYTLPAAACLELSGEKANVATVLCGCAHLSVRQPPPSGVLIHHVRILLAPTVPPHVSVSVRVCPQTDIQMCHLDVPQS